MATMKVKPWGEGQGDYVVIEESNFNPDKHQKYTESRAKAEMKPAPKKAESKAKAD